MSNRILASFILFLGLFENIHGQSAKLLKDINPGENSSKVDGNSLYTAYKGSLIFAARNEEFGHEVWIYKDNQTILLKDINVGPEDSEAANFYLINDKVVFTAKTKENGFELWVTDGTKDGTKLLKEIKIGVEDGVFASSIGAEDRFLVFKDKLYFTGIVDQDFLLWTTDGTTTGTIAVKNMDNMIHTYPSNLTVFKDEFYFSTTFFGVFKIEKNTAEVKKIVSLETAYSVLATDKFLYVLNADQLWITEGEAFNSKLIANINSPTVNWSGNRLVSLGGKVYFPNSTAATGPELWRTDGTAEGTSLVIDLLPGSDGYAPQNYTVFNGKLYYKGENEKSGIELFITDGTAVGTKIVKDINTGIFSGFSIPSTILSDSKRIYFNANSFFTPELWISDGTTDGTKTIKITPEKDTEDDPDNFFLFEDKLIVFAKSNSLGYEPYIVDFNASPIDPDKDGFIGEKDCDENNPNINAGKIEIPYNGLDDDCNALTLDDDLDKDGFNKKDDCNDQDKNINSKAKEILGNGVDENCDGKDDPILGVFNSNNSVIAFPNPSGGEFELTNVDMNSLEVISVQNKNVNFAIKGENISLQNVIVGIYIIRGKLKNENLPFTLKVIVKGNN
jgi:ELWxxDGT repeat protein